MKKIRDIIHTLTRKNSMFPRIFAGLVLISFVMVVFFGVWMNQIGIQNFRKQAGIAKQNRMKQTDDAMSLITEVLSQNMAQIMWSSDFITYMVSPNTVSATQDYRILQQLKSIADGNELVLRACLYAPMTGEVYDGLSVVSIQQFENKGLLTAHLEKGTPEKRDDKTMTVTTLTSFDNRLFMIQDLNIASHIGTLIYELNSDTLHHTLGLRGSGGEKEIYIYNQNKEEILRDCSQSDSLEPDWQDEASFLLLTDIPTKAGQQINGYYQYTAPERGWIYLMPLDTGQLTVHFGEILPMYLLAILLFLLISVVFNYYITKAIYRPINNLMQLVIQADGREKNAVHGEMGFLESVYTDALDRQSQMTGLIANIAPEIMDSMLKNLMVGKALEQQRVTEILEGVGNPIDPNGRYLVAVCKLNEPRDRTVTDVELNLHLLSIRKLIHGLETVPYRIYDIRTEKMLVALVMGFEKDYPVVMMKREYAKLSQMLSGLGAHLPYRLQVERGNLYQSIMDIRYAYREAVERLSYQNYLESSKAEAEDGTQWETHPNQIVNSLYFRERTKSLAAQAAHGEEENTRLLLAQILKDLEGEHLQLPEFRSMLEVFLDELTERAVALPLSEEDQQLLEATRAEADLFKQNNKQALLDASLNYARKTMEILHSYNQKNCYKYVKQAKEYMEQHYANSDLSLHDVCEHIGISSSYLSELFHEISKEKFTGYLSAFRVEKAAQLLRTTSLTIKEIGFCCGFNSIQNFIRVFKKHMGQTPGQYRSERT